MNIKQIYKNYFLWSMAWLFLPVSFCMAEQNIVPLEQNKRKQVLEEAQYFINYPILLQKKDVNTICFSFLPEGSIEKTTEETAFRLSGNDSDVLKELLKTHQPKGLISRNGEWYLMLSDGPLKKGCQWNVNLGGVEYKMLIVDITPKEYTVQYNEKIESVTLADVLKVKNNKEKPLKK